MPRFQRKIAAFRSEVYLSLRFESEIMAKRLLNEMAAQVQRFEKDFSRFLPTSQLSKLNLNAGTKVKSAPELINLTRATKSMVEKSRGLYNPLLLPALQSVGYVGSWPRPENFKQNLNFSNRETANPDDIEINDGWIKIPKNSALDFGGIGKGYLLDQLANFIEKNEVKDYWFSLGGDIILSGNDERQKGWEVSIANVRSGNELKQKIKTDGKRTAIATSGIMKRCGEKNDQNWHHIIDPRTNLPAKTDILSATIMTDSATEADIWAKCLVILGSKEAERFAIDKKLKAVILQTEKQIIKL